MKTILSASTLILIALFFACTENIKKPYIDDNTIVVDIEVEQRALSMKELIDSVKYIKLETTDESLITNVNKVIIEDSLLIIQDIKGKSALIFDITGRFKHKISKSGQGPGEYTEINTMMVDGLNKHIIIYDRFRRKMVFYTFEGDFVKEITNFSGGSIARDVINLSNGNFLCYFPDKRVGDNEQHEVWEVDATGKVVRGWIRYDEAYTHIGNGTSNYFYHLSESEVGLMETSLTTIYHFRADTLSKYLTYKLDAPTISKFPNNLEKGAADLYTLKAIQEKGDFILTEWVDDNMMGFVNLYHKQDMTSNTGLGVSYSPALYGTMLTCNQPHLIVMEMTSMSMLQLLDSEHSTQEEKNIIKGLVEGMTVEEIEDMNPVLQLLYVK